LGRAAFELHEALLNRWIKSLLVATTAEPHPYAYPSTREFVRRGPAKAFFSSDLLREADQLLQGVDLVHGHGLYVSTNWIFGQKIRRRCMPLVYHPHGFFEPWILQRSQWRKRFARFLFEDKNFEKARLWRALTDKEADQIRAQGIRAPIIVAPNGIRLEPFDCVDPKPRNKSRHRILFLGRLHPKKGIDLLLQAWSRLAPRYRDWEVVVAGPDEGGYLQTLRSLVRQLSLEKTVTFPGAFSGGQKIVLLKSADLFVLTSHSEGFSVALLEALACGLPVLATTPCNFPELATLGGGFECAPDLDAIARCLDQALAVSVEERRQRGNAGRRLVKDNYTWSAISQTIVEACEHHCR
jgi:glycosyltransferase involved in cell wall biosynthesis